MGNDEDDDDAYDDDDDDYMDTSELPEDVKRDPIVSKFALINPRKMVAAEKKVQPPKPLASAASESVYHIPLVVWVILTYILLVPYSKACRRHTI
jgi:hypothetical protein